ncbi:MAG: hypothetical protein WC178_01480 [Candidatus Paceibacterota bacterium]
MKLEKAQEGVCRSSLENENPKEVSEDTEKPVGVVEHFGLEREEPFNPETEGKELKEVRGRIEGNKENESDKKKESIEHREESSEDIEKSILEKEESFGDKFDRLEKLPKNVFKKQIEGIRNKISQMVADTGSIETKRGEFTNDIINAIEKVKKDGDLPEDFFENIKNMISIGSGHGENPFGILGKYLPEDERAIFIDPYAAPSEKISQNDNIRHLGQKFEDVNIKRQSGEKNIIEASNFLQLFELKEKKEALNKMVELAGPGGKIIIVDEIKRGGFNGIADWALNRFYNWNRGEYDRLSEEDYEKMFEEAELKMVTKNQYNRASFIFMLEVSEDATEVSAEAQ